MTPKDKRPDPKPRKHPHLWQAYLAWEEVMEMRKRHVLRISSIERGKSTMDAQFERDFLDEVQADKLLEKYKKTMIECGEFVGPIWDWVTSIKGVGDSLAAQLLAQIDWIGPTEERPDNLETISKLWRMCGFGLYPYWHENGKPVAPKDGYVWKETDGVREMVFKIAQPKPDWHLKTIADRNISPWVSPYNKQLKAICWNISQQFIWQQTPHYIDLYYAEKQRQRRKHPEPVSNGSGKKKFTDAHIDNRARRYMIKEFLKDLWLEWRRLEGLPVTEPYEPA